MVAAAKAEHYRVEQEVLGEALVLRNRDVARQPLQQVLHHLGVEVDEAETDYQRLAMRTLRVMSTAVSNACGVIRGSSTDPGFDSGPCRGASRSLSGRALLGAADDRPALVAAPRISPHLRFPVGTFSVARRPQDSRPSNSPRRPCSRPLISLP